MLGWRWRGVPAKWWMIGIDCIDMNEWVTVAANRNKESHQ
ncbi:hypothetical protein D083_2249 [Dickeya solani RNS 08.23.3.1.A]|nr:hypothetical protein D083_2249 [Dickeya solani RNS 08.23.3.1.A]